MPKKLNTALFSYLVFICYLLSYVNFKIFLLSVTESVQLTRTVCASFRSNVGFIGAMKQAGKMLLYMKSPNPGKPFFPPNKLIINSLHLN